MTTADRIKFERERRGWSQEYLASLLGYSGKSAISKIETSGDKVTLKTIEKLAAVFKCSKFYLMGLEDNNRLPDIKTGNCYIEAMPLNRDDLDKRLTAILNNYTQMDEYFKDKLLSQSKRLLDMQKDLED